MTIKEAIKILDPETTQEALAACCDKREMIRLTDEACETACAALRALDDPEHLRERWRPIMETDELIKALRRMGVQTGSLVCLGCGHEHGCSVHGCAVIRAAADTIEELDNFMDSQCARLLARNQELQAAIPCWISVKDRLPDRFEPVIVCREAGKVEQGHRDVKDWWKVYGARTKRVTHWMPLPEPPKEAQSATWPGKDKPQTGAHLPRAGAWKR